MKSIFGNFNSYSLFLIGLTFLLLLPGLGSIDNMSSRWLGVLILNIVFFIKIYFFKKDVEIGFNIQLLFLFSIFLLSLCSLTYSPNNSEVILFSSKLFIIFFSLYNLSICSVKLDKFLDVLFQVIIISLFIEVLYVMFDFINSSYQNIKGISMNPNFSSFSILIKIPILLYLQFTKKNSFIILILIELAAIVSLVMLSSRAALLCLPFIYFIFFFLNLKDKKIYLLNFFKFFSAIIFLVLNNQITDLFKLNTSSTTGLFTDESFLLRIEYYGIAISSISENFFLGIGSGSWKVESLRTFLQKTNETIIPYYVHNDFIQFFYELGVLGFILYCLFLMSFIIKNNKKYNGVYTKIYILSFIIFFIDSSFNFPIHRPENIISFLLLSSPMVKFTTISNTSFKKSFKLTIFFLSSLSLYIQVKEHNSLIIQDKLIRDTYTKSFSFTKEEIMNIDPAIPNLSSNTVPISTYLSRYYIYLEDYKSALKFSKKGFELNPYINYTNEIYLSSLLLNNKFEDALVISRVLYEFNLGKNEIYTETYLDLLFSLNKIQDLEEIFYDLLEENNIKLINLFLSSYSNLQIKNLNFLKNAIILSNSKFPNNEFIQILIEQYLK
jgi:O-antigen ligase